MCKLLFKGVRLINGVAVHRICTTTPTVFLFRSYSKGGVKKRKTLAFNHSKWRLFEKRRLMSAAFDNVTEAPGERLSWKFSHQGTV